MLISIKKGKEKNETIFEQKFMVSSAIGAGTAPHLIIT